VRGADRPTNKSQPPRAKAPWDRDFARACHDGLDAIVRHTAVFFAFAAALSLANCKGFVRQLWECAMRAGIVAGCIALALLVSGCTSNQPGPRRAFLITDDIEWTKPLGAPELATFYNLSPEQQANLRNQVLTARMYMADLEYHYYEARLTKEMQEEGLAATLASLGLTTAATLVPSVATKSILSGTATAVIGADKAYTEKQLLSNTMQALQTQMRADRKTQAGTIYAKMFRDISSTTRIITPIADYTLPMALSDADAYYQAGTISSALVGLSRTLANADRNADQAKDKSGPNPITVSNVKETAAPSNGGSGAGMLHGSGPSVSGPVVRSETVFGSDSFTVKLMAWMRDLPNGEVNRAHVDLVEKFIEREHLNTSPTSFAKGGQFASKRAQFVREQNIP